MASTSYKVVPKMDGYKIAIFFALSNGDIRQIAYMEVPDDKQLNDNIVFINEVLTAYKKRIRKSL